MILWIRAVRVSYPFLHEDGVMFAVKQLGSFVPGGGTLQLNPLPDPMHSPTQLVQTLFSVKVQDTEFSHVPVF